MKKLLIITLFAGLIAITGCSSTTSSNTTNSNTANNNSSPDKLSQDAAISLALADVGVSNEEISNISIKYDSENGKPAYEIEFYKDDTEYDYTIDAISGDIINSQHTIASYNASSVASATTDNTNNVNTNNVNSHSANSGGSNNTSDIGLEKAKSIALSQVSGASAANIIKAKRDYDDGILEYEIEIVYGDYEYDFEIRASDGKIIGSDQDSIYD